MSKLEEIENRLSRLEEAMREVRAVVEAERAPLPGSIPLVDKDRLALGFAEFVKRSGVQTRPGVTGLDAQQALLAEGVQPDDRLASRGIIEMREE